MPKIMLNFKTNGRRQNESPLKRILDEVEAGLVRPNW
jgi:hypothetical protein